jgi:GAF domain-containing protein
LGEPVVKLLHEPERLKVLRSLCLLDTPPEHKFDRVARLAAEVFQVPMAVVSLIDEHRQWFKSRVGIDGEETAREVAFCSVAIEKPEPLVVLDATRDLRFADNPSVTGPPHVRFYAGMPLITREGAALGTLCVFDSQPREVFNTRDRELLRELASLVMDQVEKRREAAGA